MIEITDSKYEPDMTTLDTYIENSIFNVFCERMKSEFSAATEVAFSKDSNLPGWNIRFYKSSRSLCRLYPKKGFITILIVVGKKEKERVENILPQLINKIRSVYETTKEGMGQRWLLIDIKEADAEYEDLLRLIRIRSTRV